MVAVRTHELKLRLSDAELEAVRMRAGAAPLAVWLRRLAVEGVPPPAVRRRRVRERPLHPQAAELTRIAALAANQLGRIADSLAERDPAAWPIEPLRTALTQLNTTLRRCLEAN